MLNNINDFNLFKSSITDKLDDYVKGQKNPFLSYDFKNLRLVKTPKSDYAKNKEKTEYSDHVALTRLSRAIHEMFKTVFRMFEAGEKHKDVYKIIYSYPDISERDYEKYSYLEQDGFFIFDDDVDPYLPANLSEQYAEKLLDELMLKSISIRNGKDDVQSAKGSRFFLLGEKGVGKTAFLNNIFSRYPSNMKEREVCWIRVDLTKNSYYSETLLNALNFQLAKIFREHYFEKMSEEERASFKQTLTGYFYENGRMQNELFNAAYEDFEGLFENARDNGFNKNIIKGIKRYVEKKYGLIYIFDGLDRINNNESLFRNKIKEIKNVLTNEKCKGVFIFVMRYESHRDYLLSHDDANLRNSNKMFYIIPPKLDEIINKRIDLLFSHKDKIFKDIEIFIRYGKTEEDKIKEARDTLSKFTREHYEAYLNIFLLFLYKGIKNDNNYDENDDIDDIDIEIEHWDKKEAFKELKDFFGYNYRQLLDIILSANKKFLEAIERTNIPVLDVVNIGHEIMNNKLLNSKGSLRQLLKKTYIITDFLLLGNNTLFENPFTYEYKNENQIRPKYNNRNRPYIYNLYYSINVKYIEEEKYYLLLKIRILQYISIKEGEYYKEKDIVDFFVNTFNYLKENIHIAFEELKDYGLIASVMKVNNDGSHYYIFQLSRAGKHHLNPLISAFSYINLVIDDILIPEIFQDQFKVQINNEEKKKANRTIQQYPRIINFISMLRVFEQKELENVQMKEEDKKDWIIFDGVYEKFIDTIAKVLWIYDKELKLFNKVLSENNIS